VHVWIVTINFPVPSETFACVEFQALKKQGVDITVREMGFRTTNHDRMLTEYGLEGIDRSSKTSRVLPATIGMLIKHPILFFQLLSLIVRKLFRSPKELLKSLLLVPRSIEIFEEIRRAQPDVVHLFWGHYPTLVAWLIDKYLPTQPWSIALNAYDLWMDYPITRALLPNAGFVRSISEANTQVIASQSPRPRKTITVPRGIDLSKFTESPEHKIKLRFISAGRMIPKKNFADVIQSFAEFHREHPEATLVLAGDGPERPSLEHFVATYYLQSAVQFLGHIPQAQLAKEMARSEVFLFLSEEEMLPNVAKEAMASGCVCVVRRTQGIEELIVHTENGYIVDSRDEATHCLRTLYLRPHEERSQIASRAKDRIEKHFNVDDSAAGLIDAWRELKSTWPSS
jgi:colanic acid/amylovoran biosynthesis glycosyltransferase